MRTQEELAQAIKEKCPDPHDHRPRTPPPPPREPSRIERNAAAKLIQQNFRAMKVTSTEVEYGALAEDMVQAKGGDPTFQFKTEPQSIEWVIEKAASLYYLHQEENNGAAHNIASVVPRLGLFALEQLKKESGEQSEQAMNDLCVAVATRAEENAVVKLFKRFLLGDAPRASFM